MKDKVEKQILKGSQAGNKTYKFNEQHDDTQPAQMWFQNSEEGLVLFLVFYSQACRWSKCLGCNLPSVSSQFHVSYKSIIAQIDTVFSMPEVLDKKTKIRKIIVSNNGSILDESTFSSTALMYLMAQINLHIPRLNVLSLETRVEYVEIAEMEFLKRALTEGDTPTSLELAVGFEAYDDHIRNDLFMKGLSLEKFETFIANIAPYKFSVKCYFMQKPVPKMTDEAAVEDIKKSIDYLSTIAKKYKVKINMHLNPTYAAHSTHLGMEFYDGNYTPPFLIDVAKAALHAKGKSLSVFIGLYDEGLAVPGGSFIREGDDELVDKLEQFNKTQNFDFLEQVVNP